MRWPSRAPRGPEANGVVAAAPSPGKQLPSHMERVMSVATFERQSRPGTTGFWSRHRWVIVTAVVIAIAVAVVLVIAYSGGGSGGGGGSGY